MNSREMAMAGATGAIVACAFGWTFVIRPTMDRWTSARDHRDALLDQASKAKELVERKNQIESDRRVISERLGVEGDSLFPTRGVAIADFVDHLNNLSKAAGFTPRDLKFVRAEQLDAYAEFRFDLRARAPLRQLVDFLVRMRASERYLRVQAMQIQPKEGGEVEADLSLVALVSQDVLDDSERVNINKGTRPK